ncbi:MAG TPA: SGNH/GDSL hydrolase family protein [bacterium]
MKISPALRALSSSRVLFALYLVVAVVALAELGIRVWVSHEIGPRALLYGTAWDRNTNPDQAERRWRRTVTDERFRRDNEQHELAESRPDSVERLGDQHTGYAKFFPNETKSTRDVETGERIRVTINSHGFRGQEFGTQKPPDVVRVLTLGSSSTFGYYDRDDETYPFYLERFLNDRCAGTRRFEVINFGIPHETSGETAALFLAEGLPLAPDAVTFYDGRNDTVGTVVPTTWGGRARLALTAHSLLALFVDRVLIGGHDIVDEAADKFDLDADLRSAIFLRNLEVIREACAALGIHLVVANQQATAAAPYPRPLRERLGRRGVTYAEEADRLAARMAWGSAIDYYEYALLLHRRLMDDLRGWARTRSVPFVDVIAALDHDRDQLVSWVHLTPAANRVVAGLFAEELARRFCPDAPGPAATDGRRAGETGR